MGSGVGSCARELEVDELVVRIKANLCVRSNDMKAREEGFIWCVSVFDDGDGEAATTAQQPKLRPPASPRHEQGCRTKESKGRERQRRCC
jgi:hypothetical protein